jgi:aspartate ammonia-lyase
MIAREAQATGASVYSLVLSKGLLTQAELDEIMRPESLTQPRSRREPI